jgi:CubicO group peptidase (beta-lactamase class C family)
LRRLSVATAVLISTVVFGQRTEAQVLTFSLFERYLDSFRVEAGIPGMSAAILQNGVVLWERGFGRRDVEANLAAAPDTPYLIGGLSQAFGAAILLRKCVDQGAVELNDPVSRWLPLYPEPQTTVRQLLTHTAPGGGGYQYAPGRFAALTGMIEECTDVPYRMLVAFELFDRFAMLDSAPDQVLSTPTAQDIDWFDAARLSHYAQVVSRLATPYRVVNGRAQRNTEGLPRRTDTSDGIISSVRDLARFDSVISSDVLLAPATRNLAWTQAFAGTTPLPTGLGWFVQNHNGEPLVWQFGLIHGSHSSLILKVPNRGLTLIILANSDGLNAPFALEGGDVTTSLFATLFLRLFVP